MMPLYPSARICSSGWVQEKISEYTDISRTRRAISCVYWPPKSRTAILSGASMRRPALPGPSQLLGLLEDLPFGLDRRRDDQLRQLKLADAPGAHRAHAGSDGADQVERAVLGERGPDEDLLERARDADADPRAPRLVGDDVADDERDRERFLELAEIDRGVLGGDVAGGRDGRLDHEDVGAGLLGDLREALGALRDGGHDRWPPALLDRADVLVDQLFLDRLAVNRLDDLGSLFLARRDDTVEDVVGVRVAGEDPFEVQHREAAEPAHLGGEPGPDDAVHRRGDDRQLEPVAAELPGNVDLVRIDRHGPGNERDVVAPVCDPRLAASPDPHPHRHPPPRSATGYQRRSRI